VTKTTHGHLDHPGDQYSLGLDFLRRYRKTQVLNDLETAVVHLQQAVDLTPTDDLNRAQHLRGLGASLSQRYKRLGNLKDLDAVSKFGEVLDLIGEDHPHRVKVLENLVASLTDRYQCLGDLKDLTAFKTKLGRVYRGLSI
jgi:hypothetical protein